MVIEVREPSSISHYSRRKSPSRLSESTMAIFPRHSKIYDRDTLYFVVGTRKITPGLEIKSYTTSSHSSARLFGELCIPTKRMPPEPMLSFQTRQSASAANTIPRLELFKIKFPVEFIDIQLVKSLLGLLGIEILDEVLKLIVSTSKDRGLSLNKVEVKSIRDYEVPDWRYLLVLLHFDSDFETADKFLNYLYGRLDILSSRLTPEKSELFQKVFFFDVQTTL